MISVCTTVNKEYYEKVGKSNIERFSKFWPSDIKLFVYAEDFTEKNFNNIVFLNLFDHSKECLEFVTRNKNKKFIPKLKLKPYKYDFLKFCYKSYTMISHFKNTQDDYFIWLDADIVTHNSVDIDKIIGLLDKKIFSWYLNREENKNNDNQRLRRYSETGFIIFNKNNEISKTFFEDFQNIYDSDNLFNLDEQNDSYIFDLVRNKFDQKYFLKLNNGHEENPIHQIFLKDFLYHPMGKLKNEKRHIS